MGSQRLPRSVCARVCASQHRKWADLTRDERFCVQTWAILLKPVRRCERSEDRWSPAGTSATGAWKAESKSGPCPSHQLSRFSQGLDSRTALFLHSHSWCWCEFGLCGIVPTKHFGHCRKWIFSLEVIFLMVRAADDQLGRVRVACSFTSVFFPNVSVVIV